MRALTVSAAVAAAAATVALQRRHARSIWTDPDYVQLDAPLSGEALDIVSRDGTRLHAQASGPPNGATIVLAHGWTERLSFWGPVIRILRREGLRTVAYDLRGHGRSGRAAKRRNRPASRMLGSRAAFPGFSSPVAHAAIRHAAFGPTAAIGHVAFYERMLIDCPPDVRAACGIAMSDMDLWDAVAGLTVPTLVVAGDRDRLTPPAHAQRIAASLPFAAGLIELERTGHLSPLERPEEVARAIHGLIAQPSSLIGSAS